MLNLQELRAQLETITKNGDAVPVTYYQFGKDEEVVFPCVVYYEDSTDNFGADNVVYKRIRNVTIDIYSDTRDLGIEQQLETLLTANKIFYDVTLSYIETEKLYLSRYDIQLIK